MKALIGAKTPVGHFLNTQGKYDYLIDPSNIELLRNKQFFEIVCVVSEIPEKGNLAEEKDTLRFEKLMDVLSEVRTERLTLITTLRVMNPADGYYNENTALYHSETAPDAFINNRARFEEFIQLRFGRVITIRLPDDVFDATLRPGILGQLENEEKLVLHPANELHQFIYLPLLKEAIDTSWQLGLTSLNLAPEPLSTMEVVREFAPSAVAKLRNADESTVLPPVAHSLHSIHWYDPEGYICPKATVIQQLKSVFASYQWAQAN